MPGIIVVVVVMIWVMFNWLAQMGNDRDAFVRALSRNNEARWQAAFNLANALRAERGSTNPKLTGDPNWPRNWRGFSTARSTPAAWTRIRSRCGFICAGRWANSKWPTACRR